MISCALQARFRSRQEAPFGLILTPRVGVRETVYSKESNGFATTSPTKASNCSGVSFGGRPRGLLPLVGASVDSKSHLQELALRQGYQAHLYFVYTF